VEAARETRASAKLRPVPGLAQAGIPRVRTTAWRCRPGDEPTWIDADFDRSAAELLRARAAKVALTVDVCIALMLELDQGVGGSRVGNIDQIRARAESEPVQIAPSGDLRAWQRWLSRGSEMAISDELPELVLPERLTDSHVDPRVLVPLICGPALGMAIKLDLHAAGHGQTMAAWMTETVEN
jgi:hypothetical protein